LSGLLTGKKALLIGGSALLFAGILTVALNTNRQNLQANLSRADEIPLGAFPITVPTLKYGFALDTFQVTEGRLEPNRVFSDLLVPQGVTYPTIDQIVANANGVFDLRKLQSGKPYMILAKDQAQGPDYFIYEPNVYEYIVFELKGDLKVQRMERPVQKEMRQADGVLESSLWQTMVDNGLSYELTAKMEDALQWSIDFHHLQKGDEFKLVFEENIIDGEVVGVDKVYAAYYQTLGTEFHAIWYEHGDIAGYYDLEGRPMKKSFLKAPVKYSRISSHYNLNRFHPILKRTRPHLGTDYAAPYGTPIYAVGDGVVVEAGYSNGNGNYVKIKHNDTYQTQYLHMQKFANGVRKGVHVQQGQVIGYVGSTGLATGPHVCFRFWKNGKQVNHLKLNFPPPAPLPDEELPAFRKVRDHYLEMLQLQKEQPTL
jgi:murein DD-endopeptidase MepM/ murein hydrolase activator NlpD